MTTKKSESVEPVKTLNDFPVIIRSIARLVKMGRKSIEDVDPKDQQQVKDCLLLI